MKTGIAVKVRHNGEEGEATVAAIVRGDWAIHRTPFSEDRSGDAVWESWSLTHVPTGLAFINAAPGPARIRCALAEVMSLPVDWANFADFKTLRRTGRRRARYIRDEYNTGGRWRHRPLRQVEAQA